MSEYEVLIIRRLKVLVTAPNEEVARIRAKFTPWPELRDAAIDDITEVHPLIITRQLGDADKLAS